MATEGSISAYGTKSTGKAKPRQHRHKKSVIKLSFYEQNIRCRGQLDHREGRAEAVFDDVGVGTEL